MIYHYDYKAMLEEKLSEQSARKNRDALRDEENQQSQMQARIYRYKAKKEREMADFLNIQIKQGIDTKYGKLYKGYINIEEFIKQLEILKENGKYVNFILGYNKEKDKYYMKIDNWKPEKKEENITNAYEIEVDEIPF